MVESTQVFEDSAYEQKHSISLATAEYRERFISDVSYQVDLTLPKGEWYAGNIGVSFTLKQLPTQELFLDFRGVKIGHLTINGEPVTQANIFRD